MICWSSWKSPSAAPKTQHQKQHATQDKFGARVVRHRYLAISSRYSLHANTSGTVRRTVSSSMGVSQMWDVAVKEPTTRRRGKVQQVSHPNGKHHEAAMTWHVISTLWLFNGNCFSDHNRTANFCCAEPAKPVGTLPLRGSISCERLR